MDERRLAELMNDAVAEAPPPSFDERDVAMASERLRVRRRNGLIAGSAATVAALAGASVLAMALWTGSTSENQATSGADKASSSNGNAAPYEVPNEAEEDSASAERGDQKDVPSETPKQGGSSSGNAGPAGPGGTPSGCEKADRELAAALAGELPAAASYDRDAPQSVELHCPAGSSGAAFPVREGQQNGTVSVVLIPADGPQPAWQLPQGADLSEARTADDETVVVISVPASGKDAPLAGDLDAIAAGVAARY